MHTFVAFECDMPQNLNFIFLNLGFFSKFLIYKNQFLRQLFSDADLVIRRSLNHGILSLKSFMSLPQYIKLQKKCYIELRTRFSIDI